MPKIFLVMELTEVKRLTDYISQIPATNRPDLLFDRETDAINHAQKLASEKVGKEIVVYTSVFSVSARRPQIITKKFNDKGELIPLDG